MKFELQPLGFQLGETVVNPGLDLVEELSPDRLLRTGFERVHWTSGTPLDLATKIFDAPWGTVLAGLIDAVVFVSSSQGGDSPGPGRRFVEVVGINQSVPIFDLNDACTGFISGLKLASALLLAGHSKVLLVTADAYSGFLGVRDTSLGAIFSDAASAVLVSAEPHPQVETGFSNYAIHEAFYHFSHQLDLRQALSSATRTSETGPKSSKQLELNMNGAQVFSFVLSHLPRHVNFLRQQVGLSPEDLTWFVHQGSKKVVEEVRRSLGISQDLFNAGSIGNTVSSSIPIQIMEESSGGPTSGWLAMATFGVGLSFASSFLKVDEVSG